MNDNSSHPATLLKSFATYLEMHWRFLLAPAASPLLFSLSGILPVFEFQKWPLSLVTPIFCSFVTLYIFSLRHDFGVILRTKPETEEEKSAFREHQHWPLYLALGSLASFGAYIFFVRVELEHLQNYGKNGGLLSRIELLRTSPLKADASEFLNSDIFLVALYVAAFALAQGAVAWLTVKAFIQHELEMSDSEIVQGRMPVRSE